MRSRPPHRVALPLQRRASSSRQEEYERRDESDDEENPRDLGRCPRDTGHPKKARYDCDD